MKILLVNKYWYPRGGTERVVLLTKKLLENSGHTVEIFGMKHPRNEFENDYFVDQVDYAKITGLKKFKAGVKSIYNWDAKKRFAKLVENFQPDVIHFHNIYHQLSWSLLDVIRKTKIPAVMTLHDYKLISPNYNLFLRGKIYERCVGGKYYRCVLNNCLDNFGQSITATIEAYGRAKPSELSTLIKYFISPSEFLKEKFVRTGFLDNKIKVIPNALDLDNFGVQEYDKKYAAYAGRLSEEKGLDYLLSTAKLTPFIRYKIIGEGKMGAKLRKRVMQEKINNVEFTGYQTGEELKSLIANARVLIVPSIWYENYPQSILEAKAMGKIVLASKIGGIPEMLPPELLVEPKNPLVLAEKVKYWYSCADDERQSMGERLRREVEGINGTEEYLRELTNIYHVACNM